MRNHKVGSGARRTLDGRSLTLKGDPGDRSPVFYVNTLDIFDSSTRDN